MKNLVGEKYSSVKIFCRLLISSVKKFPRLKVTKLFKNFDLRNFNQQGILVALGPRPGKQGNKKITFYRSSRREVFFKGVHKTFAGFTGKHLCRSLFFKKVTGLNSATLLKKRIRRRFFC